jgi:diacylglycerol kinase
MVDLNKLVRSFGHALAGIKFAIIHNQNLRIHFATALFVITASIFFHVTPFEKGILGVMILLVITAEMINTSIEEMADLILKEHSREAKIAKDVSAGMVLLTAVGSVIVGLLIFVPYVLRYLSAY